LYRISVARITEENNNHLIIRAKKMGIMCGIHYHALHNNKVFRHCKWNDLLINSETQHSSSVSIPFHENLTTKEIAKVIKFFMVNE